MRRFLLVLFCTVVVPAHAWAQSQSFEAGIGAVLAYSNQFDDVDLGVSGRLAWNPSSILGIEGEATLYPGEFPGGVGFSARRVEGLFGMTIGPRIHRVRPFARARAGFLAFAAASGPMACITIYPPPLACVLAAGATMPAFDLGGGLEVGVTDRAFVRADAGVRYLKYPGPSFSRAVAYPDGFYSPDVRLAFSGGFKF
jgi:hypothetical protein